VFAARCAQSRSSNLAPWQLPPFRASLRDLDKLYGDPSGKRESAELLKKMLDLGLSPFEPSPMRPRRGRPRSDQFPLRGKLVSQPESAQPSSHDVCALRRV
jgi:hypothetical protein